MDLTTRRLELRVERVVLDGVPVGQRHAFGRAFARELHRLAATLDLAGASVCANHLDAGHVVAATNDGAALGVAVARAVVQEFHSAQRRAR